jgi:hypothetical protein
VLYGENAQPTVSLGLATNWSPFLIFMDKTGSVRTAIGNTSAFPPSMTQIDRRLDFTMIMVDAKGKPIWKAP